MFLDKGKRFLYTDIASEMQNAKGENHMKAKLWITGCFLLLFACSIFPASAESNIAALVEEQFASAQAQPTAIVRTLSSVGLQSTCKSGKLFVLPEPNSYGEPTISPIIAPNIFPPIYFIFKFAYTNIILYNSFTVKVLFTKSNTKMKNRLYQKSEC
jgi:hypothetical protein